MQDLVVCVGESCHLSGAEIVVKKFKELIERFPKSERADNAQFWIGEIYYREKWYEKAILEYQKVNLVLFLERKTIRILWSVAIRSCAIS